MPCQFNRAMQSVDEDEWFTDEVWLNPWSNNHAVMIFVKAINPGQGRRPEGVLYLEFDWEALMADVLHAPDWHSPGDDDGLKISIVDPAGNLVGSSFGGQFGMPVTIPPRRKAGDRDARQLGCGVCHRPADSGLRRGRAALRDRAADAE